MSRLSISLTKKTLQIGVTEEKKTFLVYKIKIKLYKTIEKANMRSKEKLKHTSTV